MSADKFRGVVRHLRRLDHRVRIAAVDLDPDRCLVVCGLELGVGLLRVPDQTFGRNEFRIDHIRPLLPAYSSERSVCNVFHRSQKHRPFPEIYIPNCHIVAILCLSFRLAFSLRECANCLQNYYFCMIE